MFYITFATLWSVSYFFLFVYIILLFSIILYVIPTIKDVLTFTKFKNYRTFDYITGLDLYWFFLTPIFIFFIINFAWCGPVTSAWFGNLVFAGFQYKFSFFAIFFFYLILVVYSTSFYFCSKEAYDYMLTCFNFFFWIYFLFFANTLFTVIFFVEILSTLIFLLLITSTFSSTYFFNNLNLNLHSYFSSTAPLFFVQMLMYFFWISLISSLNLFFFLIIFYIKFLTFDWFLFEFIFFYVITLSQLKDFFFIIFVWFNLLFCIFLKCGLVPFYFWKPMFFKGIPLHALFFYISFFFFFIFVFFLYFFLIYVNEIFYFFLGINICLLLIGFLVLLAILCEAYYLKSFLALSSILNTLFVFLALNGINFADFFFFCN